MTLPVALIGLAVLLLVVGPTLGLVFFSADRARSVKLAEIAEEVVAARLRQVAVYHPEIVKRYRLDRHDFYVFVNLGLWMYGWGVILASAPNSNLSGLSWSTQHLLGMCLLVGTSISLIGASLGLRLGRVTIARRVSDNLLSELLGDDLRMPYVLGWCGLLSTGVSLWLYAYTIWETATSRLLGTLGGGLSAGIACACVTLGVRLIVASRHYSAERDALLAEVVAGIEEQ